jgi:lipopolysaccharide assembly outer membrane protein LptD (OstA)
VRPNPTGLPVKNLTYAIYGDHDWKQGLRTLDTELAIGPIGGINWTIDYRTDSVVQGAVGVTGSTRWFERWDVFGGTQRDLERKLWLSYMFGVRRNDHDWSIEAYLVYNTFTEQTSFNIDFVPKLGAFAGAQRDRNGNGNLQAPLRSPH